VTGDQLANTLEKTVYTDITTSYVQVRELYQYSQLNGRSVDARTVRQAYYDELAEGRAINAMSYLNSANRSPGPQVIIDPSFAAGARVDALAQTLTHEAIHTSTNLTDPDFDSIIDKLSPGFADSLRKGLNPMTEFIASRCFWLSMNCGVMIMIRWLCSAMVMFGMVLAGQGDVVRDAAPTCVLAVDDTGTPFQEFQIDAVEMRYGRVIRTISGKKCFTGRSGDVFALTVRAVGYYPANLILELDVRERVRVVQLRPGLFETIGAAISGDANCQEVRCTVKAIQIDGEHSYTADVSNGRTFRIPSVRPGGYVLVLQRNGKLVCSSVLTVTEFTRRDYAVDLSACEARK
jgi:hypothetical protein